MEGVCIAVDLHYYCDYCNKDLGKMGWDTYQKVYKQPKAQGKRGHFCNEECYEKYAKQFEITYKDKIMYKMGDEEYVPYIGCHYYFKTVEECYQRMCSNVAILP